MREGELIAAFINRYQGLLPADHNPNHNFIKQHFIRKLLLEVQTPWAVSLYHKKKNIHEIAKECNKVYKCLLLSHSNKPSSGRKNTPKQTKNQPQSPPRGPFRPVSHPPAVWCQGSALLG